TRRRHYWRVEGGRVIVAVLMLSGALLSGLPKSPGFSGALAQNWQELSPRQKYDALRNYRQYEQLPEGHQRDIEQRYQRWQAMPRADTRPDPRTLGRVRGNAFRGVTCCSRRRRNAARTAVASKQSISHTTIKENGERLFSECTQNCASWATPRAELR